MNKKKLLNVPKPYGFVDTENLSEDQIADLKKLFSSQYHDYLNYESVEIIDFQKLSRIDGLIKYNFEYNLPINHLLSIVDWTSHEMMGGKNVVKHFLKESMNYFIMKEERLYDINVFELVWRNFVIYSSLVNSNDNTGSSFAQLEKRKLYEKMYIELPDFTEICIKAYCFQNIRDKVAKAPKISKEEQTEKIKKWKSLFLEIYSFHKDLFFENERFKGLDVEWSRKSMLFLVDYLSCHTRVDLNPNDEVLNILLNDIEPCKEDLISKYDYIFIKMLSLDATASSLSVMNNFLSPISKEGIEKFSDTFIKYEVNDSNHAIINFMPFLYNMIDIQKSQTFLILNILKTGNPIFIDNTMKDERLLNVSIRDLKSVIEKSINFSNQNRYLEKSRNDTTGYEFQKELIKELEGYKKYKDLDNATKEKIQEENKKIRKI